MPESLSIYFTHARPAALGLPHLITALDADLIGQVSHLTKSRPGVWPMPAPFDDADRFDNTRETAPLAAWALPLNLAEVQGLRWHVAEAVFGAKVMFVDSAADEKALTELAVCAGRRLDTGAWVTDGYEDLSTLPALLARIGWALIPVGPERARALFITSPAQLELVDKLRDWAGRQGRNISFLRETADALSLTDEAAPEKFRANAITHRLDQFLGEMETFFGDTTAALPAALAQRATERRALRERIERAKHSPPSA